MSQCYCINVRELTEKNILLLLLILFKLILLRPNDGDLVGIPRIKLGIK